MGCPKLTYKNEHFLKIVFSKNEEKGFKNGLECHPYGFVGIEEVNELDLGLIAMDWRHYDPSVGRFLGIDVMAESYYEHTPYHYSMNSPIMYNDPTGLFTDVVNEDTGEKYHVEDGYDFEFSVSNDEFNQIKEDGAINKGTSAYNRWFWAAVWNGVTTSDGSVSDEITAFLVTDDIKDVGEVVTNQAGVGNMALGVAIAIGAGKLKKLKKLARWVKKKGNRGKKIPGTAEGGKKFANDGRDGGAILPKKDANGNPITYTEYDVNKAPKHGANRGKERMVVGSDGKTYYTRNHYQSFKEFKH